MNLKVSSKDEGFRPIVRTITTEAFEMLTACVDGRSPNLGQQTPVSASGSPKLPGVERYLEND